MKEFHTDYLSHVNLFFLLGGGHYVAGGDIYAVRSQTLIKDFVRTR
jgi:hypothetical protein